MYMYGPCLAGAPVSIKWGEGPAPNLDVAMVIDGTVAKALFVSFTGVNVVDVVGVPQSLEIY